MFGCPLSDPVRETRGAKATRRRDHSMVSELKPCYDYGRARGGRRWTWTAPPPRSRLDDDALPSRCTGSATISSSSTRAQGAVAMDAGAGAGDRRPAHRRRLRPGDPARAVRRRRRADADLECRRRRGRGLRQCDALRGAARGRQRHDRDQGRHPAPATPTASTWARPASAGTRSRSLMRWTRRRCRSAGRICRSGAAVNVGNPHIVFFVRDADAVDLARLGPLIEHDPLFPERVNVNVASFEDDAIRLASGSAAPA